MGNFIILDKNTDMRNYFFILILILSACASTKKQYTSSNTGEFYAFDYIEDAPFTASCIKGNLFQENGEPLLFATVRVYDSTGVLRSGVATDEHGAFQLCLPYEGMAKLQVDYTGYISQSISIPLKYEKTLIFDDTLVIEEPKVELLKPLIYLYPTKDTKVKVEVDVKDGKLKHCYPRYDKGWKVKAKLDGTLKDKKGRSYYGLYWEADVYNEMSFSNANLVAKENLIQFLESSLDALGLTEREANEFIMFWLPRLEENDYNLIHFSTEEYKNRVPLKVKPEPDQQIRIMMLYAPATKNTLFPIQLLKRVERKKDAFVLVEWGGAKIEHPLKNTSATEGKGSIFKNM